MTFSNSVPNLCFNPGLLHWQNDKVIPNISAWTVLGDGFVYGNPQGTGRFTCRQITSDLPPDPRIPAALEMECISTQTPMLADYEHHIRYVVPGSKLRPFQNSNIRFRFWVYSAKTGVHCVTALNQARSHHYVCEYVVNQPNTWELKEISFPMGSKLGSWLLGEEFGIAFRFCMGNGANLQSSAGSWIAGNKSGTANQVNLLDAVGNKFRITGLQICPDVLPDFCMPDLNESLTEALKLYRVISAISAGVTVAVGQSNNPNDVNFAIMLPQPMYEAPNVLFKGALGVDVGISSVQTGALMAGQTGLLSFRRTRDIAMFAVVCPGVVGCLYNLRLLTTKGKLVLDGNFL